MPDVRVSIPILFLCFGLLAAPAAADCVSACQASTYCDSEMNGSGECGRRLNDCYINECSKQLYGSIAYGAQSGSHGYSHDFDDAHSAENEALRKCAADDCEVVVDFWNTCAAVAAGGDIVRYGLGDNETLAQSYALTACEEDGGSNCSVQAWSCSNN